ncbi:Uncharacterized protein dnl_30610 [Desulfonema limicola]|uniref:Uncharacterized protein n=1 Tax=Desulfonema limicola TaxID=45656 RepID=A0A975B8E5_9BACT|nr:Uncharacterized protein dnl_30610 [Desulfonema limicola]
MKTRIETMTCLDQLVLPIMAHSCTSMKTRIETIRVIDTLYKFKSSQLYFHENKD